MEKRTLGRGLEEISDIFLSTTKKKDEQGRANGFSAVSIREETCASCANMIEGSSREPKCRIFTFENKKYGVPHLDTISLNYANYCENFEPETKESPDDTENLKTDTSDQTEVNCEIEKSVTVQKKIAYPDNEAARKDIKTALSNYLERGFSIESIQLKKFDETSTPMGKETRKEEVIIFVKRDKSP